MANVEIPHLSIGLARSAAGAVVHLAGEVDMETAPLLSEAMDRLIRSCAVKIIVDCQDLTYIDSTGISVLVHAWSEMRGRVTMPIVVTNVQPQVQRVLEICGIIDLMTE